ncbi:MAG: BTAD domain-containing putative transcriptional regulator, partial [Candidatus Bipolaricaulia bacterium]
YLHALKELAAYYTEQKDYTHAIAWARRALAVSPLQEDLHRAVMQLYALTGDRAAALRQYADCQALLQKELNATPLPETQALYERILHHRPLDFEVGMGRMPILPSRAPFVGRETELRMLTQLWHQAQEGQGQAVFIGGELGVGKTALVQQFIEQAFTPSPLSPLSLRGERARCAWASSSPARGGRRHTVQAKPG